MSPRRSANRSTAPKSDGSRPGVIRSLGLGLITGAADDDPSAIGTYAAAGAKLGPAFLWTAPATFPMMFAVVYLSAKLGQVTGKGLFAVIRDAYPTSSLLRVLLVGVLVGNTIEAAADIGGMAAALDELVSIPFRVMTVTIAAVLLALQLWGSYTLIRNIFRWLALSLLAYVGAAFLARPDWRQIAMGSVVPTLQFNREFLELLVAVIGTSLSAYLYTWQSNEEVEEEIAMGRRRLSDRQGATDLELKHSQRDILSGMFFSNAVMYFIILATASTLYANGQHEIQTAAQAAAALKPLAGNLAGTLFALGVVAVGFLAVPVMTTGAAYDLAQVMGWRHSLHARPSDAPAFYRAIVGFTAVAVAINFLGFNPMRLLVWSGIVQGFSTPPLMLLIMRLTSRPDVMGDRVNGRAISALGWVTTVAIFAASAGLVISWIV